ncbi:hypothetical protein [Mesobacillus maritimus]|uniref:hypothetical protein n=1 Tax=Mesobacillus maritimus TaxID=1643336 RepID=UPI00384F8787
MRKNNRPIQGRQVTPNPIGPECIRVTKVYDWVVLTNRDRNKVPIPEECFAQIENCRHQGSTITATCSEVEGTRDCDFVGSRPAPEDFGPGAQIVTLAFHVHMQVQFLCDGALLPGCTFVVPVSFVDDVILCFPEGTEINCNIFDVQCSVVLNQMLGNMVMLDVVMCKDVQVEAEVKLEVEAKFCGPRAIVPIPEEEVTCPIPTFPPQCPTFFPPLNCECQGAAEFSGTATIGYAEIGLAPSTPTGQLDLTAIVCDQCTLAGSSLTATFVDTPAPTPIGTPDDDLDQSFTFTATEFEQPECIGDTTLTVEGTGTFTPAGGVPENATFALTLVDVSGADALTLVITAPSAIVTIPLTVAANAGLEVEVDDCDRF